MKLVPEPDPTDQDKTQRAFAASPVRWDTLTAAETVAHLRQLNVWLTWLTGRYALDHRTIPGCWREHGALVEELAALHTAWLSAYAITSPGGAPLAWHAAFAIARIRLSDWVARTGCRPGEHRQSK